jgi:hypothetical protein
MSASVTPMHGECFFVRPDKRIGGWGVVVIDEKSGLFMAHTDFGTYSTHWTAPGDKGLRHFLGKIDFDYAMNRLAANHGEVFDADLAVRNLRKQIIENRRNGEIDTKTARFAWAAIDEMEGDYLDRQENLFYDRIVRSRFILDAIGHDDWHHAINGRAKCPSCIGFWNNIYIPFVASYMPDHNLKLEEYTRGNK